MTPHTLVTGAGGVIGHHLVGCVKHRGHTVRGRNSDNSLPRQVPGREPEVSLEYGVAETYRWIEGGWLG